MVYGLVTLYFIMNYDSLFDSKNIDHIQFLEVVIYTLLLSIVLSHRRDVGGQEFGGMYCAILIVK